MKTLEIEKTSPSVRKAIRLAKAGVVVLTENGKPAFALVEVKDEFALEALALSRNVKFMDYLDEISARAKSERTYTLKEMRAEYAASSRRRKRA